MTIQIYDTTLRDGTQRTDISLSCSDKLNIARRLDDLGVAFIEGGWPGSNPKDVEFFQRAAAMTWKHAKIAAFGATCGSNGKPAGRCQYPGPARCRHSCLHRGRQNLHPACHTKCCAPPWRTTCASSRKAWLTCARRAGGSSTTPSILRRLQAGSGLRPGDLAGRRARRRRDPGAVRHQRRHDALGDHRHRRGDPGRHRHTRWASTPTTTASAPWPTPWRRCAKAASRCRAPSTAMASAAATPTCARSSPTWS